MKKVLLLCVFSAIFTISLKASGGTIWLETHCGVGTYTVGPSYFGNESEFREYARALTMMYCGSPGGYGWTPVYGNQGNIESDGREFTLNPDFINDGEGFTFNPNLDFSGGSNGPIGNGIR